MKNRFLFFLSVIICLAAVSGCESQEQDGKTTITFFKIFIAVDCL